MKNILVIIFVFGIAFNLFAQKEFNNWFHSTYYGLTFNSAKGEPNFMNYIFFYSEVPTASISDVNGNLLFYTDGSRVWNKNNEIMENGSGLLGDNLYHGSIQTLIVPKPGKNNIYYIFSTGTYFIGDTNWQDRDVYLEKIYGNNSGLNYSIVDMNSNNGLGEIIEKNIYLLGNISGQVNASVHANGKDIWVITRNRTGTIFYSFLMTENGINNPILSTFKSVIPENHYYYSRFGPLVKSLDGRIFASSFSGSWDNYWSRLYDYRCHILPFFDTYNFDNKTGIFSNHKYYLNFYDAPVFGGINKLLSLSIIDVKLSPKGSKLYLKLFGSLGINDQGYTLIQFDLESDSISMINNCEIIDNISPFSSPNMQIGPDKKIYFVDHSNGIHLNVINNPDQKGFLCGFQKPYFSYSLGTSLPNDAFYSPFIVAKPYSDTVCFGEDVVVKGNVNSAMPTETILWEGPNGFSSNDSNLYFPNATTTINGWYKITATSNGDTITDSTYVLVYPKNPDVLRIIPSDSTALCRYGSVLLAINKPRNDYKYLWSTGDTTESINVNQEGKYYITISDSNGCEQYDSVKVFIKDIKPEIEIIGNTPTCDGDTVIFRAKEEYAKYNWTTGDTTRELILTKSTRCELSVIDSLGCSGTSESAEVIFYTVPKTILKGLDRVCLGAEERYYINKTNKDTVIWKIEGGVQIANSGTDTIIVKWNTPGNGKIVVKQVSNVGCIGIDSIEVFVVDDVKPEILPKKKVICGNGNLTLTTAEKYANYEWSTGETTENIVVNISGEYWLKVTDIAGCEGSDTVQVTRANAPQPQITGNPFLCKAETTILSSSEIYEKYLWNTGDTTQSIIVSTPGTYSVEITDSNGCTGTASIEVKAITIALSGLKDIDFGRVGIGNEAEQTITLTNNTNEAVTINRIYTKNSTNEFDITTNPALPLTFAENENIGIDIKFEPKNLQEYIDSLIIEITAPCEVNYLNELSGIGTAKLLVSLPDLIYPVDTTICIPITGKLISNNNINIKTTYNTTISYESSAFYPNIAFQKVGDEIQIKLENQELSIGTDSKVIGEICGGVLLANQKTTDLIFKEFTSINPYLDIETQDGSLTIAGCVIDLSRIHLSEQLEILLKPNPASDEINLQIRSSEANNYKIAIYNSTGNELKTMDLYLNKGQNDIKLEMKDLSNGIYWVKIVLPDGTNNTKPFIIEK